jgi:hypothetical protein
MLLILTMAASSLYFISTTAYASNIHPQASYQTPTPDADGRIVYIVKAGDTCLSISLLTRASLDSIRALNNLDANCAIFSGQQLLLAVVTATPITPTSETITTPSGPTQTPFRGNGQICVVLFDDADGNGIKSDAEGFIPEGNISISDRVGAVSLTGKTPAGPDPVCFIDIPEGDYNISVAVPETFNPTTSLNYPLSLKAGDVATIDFGAQSTESSSQNGPSTSPLLGIIGVVLLLTGIGLGIYVWRSGRLR